jgi:hypothetical protein
MKVIGLINPCHRPNQVFSVGVLLDQHPSTDDLAPSLRARSEANATLCRAFRPSKSGWSPFQN